MNQREYEDQQIWLDMEVERAMKALWAAQGSRASQRVIANREKALEQAQDKWNRFMENVHIGEEV